MRKPWGLSGMIWGLLTIVVAALMLEAGIREVLAYWGQEALPTVVGALGASASCLLLVAGVALAAHRPSGRIMAAAGAVSMIAVHLAGWVLGIVGYGGVLPGIAYPLLLLILLGARPKLGGPMKAAVVDGRSGGTRPTKEAHDRGAASVAKLAAAADPH